jgi:hypothetical protein
MRGWLIFGAILIAGGLYVLIRSPSYSEDKSLFKVGSVQATVTEEHPIPSWMGGAAIALGVVLVALGIRGKT